MAPSPYLEDLPMKRTIVIEPWEVILALKGSTTYIRSYCDTFLKEMSKYCNIVYWTDCMPDFIDNLVDKLPPGKVLYRYHCRYVLPLPFRKMRGSSNCCGGWELTATTPLSSTATRPISSTTKI
jgi:hypothetical protein